MDVVAVEYQQLEQALHYDADGNPATGRRGRKRVAALCKTTGRENRTHQAKEVRAKAVQRTMLTRVRAGCTVTTRAMPIPPLIA